MGEEREAGFSLEWSLDEPKRYDGVMAAWLKGGGRHGLLPNLPNMSDIIDR